MEIKEYDFNLKDKSREEIKEWAINIPKDNVVLFRNQDLSKQDLVNIYKGIGRTYAPRKKEFFCDDEYPELFRVTNKRVNGEKTGVFADKELDWHSNGNARDQGKECCIALYCVQEGVDSVTSFCDMRQAYRDLPIAMKDELDYIECLYGFENGTFYDLEEDDKELGVDRPGESSVPGGVSGESRLAQDRRASTQSRLISSPLGEAHLASSPSVRLM